MRTPYGTECPFFFGEYHRGRDQNRCDLIGNASPPRNWTPTLCKSCQVPTILRANGCTHMHLSAEVKPGIFRLGKSVKVTAYCTRSHQDVKEPHVGCGQCHKSIDFQIEDPSGDIG
jgi:hypothetical protein